MTDQELIERVARELAAEDLAALCEMHFCQARRVIPIIAQREREKVLRELLEFQLSGNGYVGKVGQRFGPELLQVVRAFAREKYGIEL